MGVFTDKLIKINDYNVSYLWYEPENIEHTVLLLAPGLESSEFYRQFIPHFPNYYRFIAPDFPGRGKTDKIPNGNSIKSIAYLLKDLIQELNLDKLSIFAVSYGTAIANDLVDLIPNKIDKVVLLGAGEYVIWYLKPFAYFFLFFGAINDTFSKLYLKFLSIFIRQLRNFPSENLSSLVRQYISAMNYRINYKQPNKNVTAYIINFNLDKIVIKSSIKKLKKFYKKHIVKHVEIPHVVTEENTNRMMKEVLTEMLDEFKWKYISSAV